MGTVKFRKSMVASILSAMDGPLPERTTGKGLRMLLVSRERRCGSTLFCTRNLRTDWHQGHGSGVRADAVMDRIIHDIIWIETGSCNMCDKVGAVQQRRTRWGPLAHNGNNVGPQNPEYSA